MTKDLFGASYVSSRKFEFLVKPFDLKNKILKLIKNKKLRKKLSNHGNKYLIDNFSIDTMISKVENLYN